jgi:hypothetical protein
LHGKYATLLRLGKASAQRLCIEKIRLPGSSINMYNIIWIINTHGRREMRTNVTIDDKLMESALKASGIKTKKDIIKEGLKLLLQMKNQ